MSSVAQPHYPHNQVVKLRSELYAADEPANFYVETADGRTHLVSAAEWYEVMWAIHDDPTLRFRAAGDDCFVVEASPQPAPKSSRPATVVEAVEEIAAMGKEKKPELTKRLDSAVALVLGGKVVLKGEAAKVSPYTVSDVACTCADFQHRGGWCKHRLAVRMARHIAAHGFEIPTEATAPRPIVARPRGNIRQKDMELIASGKVLDDAQRARTGYALSEHGARTAALRMLGNGAKSIPADLARRAGMAGNGRKEN